MLNFVILEGFQNKMNILLFFFLGGGGGYFCEVTTKLVYFRGHFSGLNVNVNSGMQVYVCEIQISTFQYPPLSLFGRPFFSF